MRAKLVCYELKAKPTRRTMLHKKLYGYQDFSNHGRYRYSRIGLVTKVKAERIIDGVLLVAEKQVKSIVNLLKKFGAKIRVFTLMAKIKD